MSRPPPPQPPVPSQQLPSPPLHHHLLSKPTSFPDAIFTALSIFILLSPSPPKSTNRNLSFSSNLRRFFKISTTMSIHSPNPGKKPSQLSFASPQSLTEWLRPRLPSDSFASWGVKPGTKNVHNLWLEISEGETVLADSSPPVRKVEVVIVRVVGNDKKVLVESHQELSNGSVRARCRPLSEKMKPGESVESASYRAVKEELGSILKKGPDSSDSSLIGIMRIVPGSYVKKEEERVSISYPGLPASYVLHTVDAEVEGLPDGEFFTEEVDEYQGRDESVMNCAVSCKKHFWKWVDCDSV